MLNSIRRRRRETRGGFTLIETLLAMCVIFIAMAGLISAILVCSRLRQLNEDKALARNAAEHAFSAIRGMGSLPDAYGRFGGGGSEETFTVRGLADPAPNQPAARVIVWRRKSSLKNRTTPPNPDPGSAMAWTPADLLAAQAAFSSAFPGVMDTMADAAGTGWDDYLDTNGDGAVNGLDEPQLMPVTLRLRWRTHSGVTTQYFSAIIGNR
jgi:type II secretory pathway pseudopilin PulG